jgi:hypothetical protein
MEQWTDGRINGQMDGGRMADGWRTDGGWMDDGQMTDGWRTDDRWMADR